MGYDCRTRQAGGTHAFWRQSEPAISAGDRAHLRRMLVLPPPGFTEHRGTTVLPRRCHTSAGVGRIQVWVFDSGKGLREGEVAGFLIHPNAEASSGDEVGDVRITLVWTDYPGRVGAQRTLVNDLDLNVSVLPAFPPSFCPRLPPACPCSKPPPACCEPPPPTLGAASAILLPPPHDPTTRAHIVRDQPLRPTRETVPGFLVTPCL